MKLFAISLTLGFWLVGLVQNAPAPATRLVPVQQNKLPYEGFGSVTIVDDGTLIVEIGGEQSVAYTSDDEFVVTTPYDAFTYRVATAGLSLVDTGKEVFLDRNGKQLRDRGLRSGTVFRTLFPEISGSNAERGREALVWFSGDMNVQFNEKSSVLTLRIKDTAATGRVFSLSAPIVVRHGSANVDDGEITLTKPDSVMLDASKGSVVCNRGSASIECSNSGCSCVCKHGAPSCICTDAQQ